MSNKKWSGVLVAMGVGVWLVEPASAQEAPVPEGTPVPAAIAEAAAAPVAAAAVTDAPTSAESLEALRAPEGPAFAWLSLTLGKTFESEGPVALVSLTSSFGTPEVAPLSTK